MKTRVVLLVAALALVVAFTGACATGALVPITAADISVLNGWWEGDLESRGQDGRVYFSTSVYIKFSNGKAETLMGTGATWESPVRVFGGKVILLDSYNIPREFELRRVADGKLLLTTTYEFKWEQWLMTNSVTVKKK